MMKNDPLNEFFDTPVAVPSSSLMNAILLDATREQMKPVVAVKVSVWTRLMDQLGGVGGLVGLAACACVGVWLGYADITSLSVFENSDDVLLTDLGLSLDDVFLES